VVFLIELGLDGLLPACVCVESRRWLALKRLAPMSTNPQSVARARLAENGESASRITALSPRDLAEIENVIVRIEALLNAAPSDCSDAIERVADIAFVLHERDIEASLCDALDAAVREISAAGVRQQASIQRAHQAAELLRALSQRLNEIIAQAECSLQRNAKGSIAPPGADSPKASPITSVASGNRASEGESSLAAVQAAASPRSPTPPPWDPEDDPGDLFEPIAAVPTAARSEPEIAAAVPPPSAPDKATVAAVPPVNTPAPTTEHNGAASGESSLRRKPPSEPRQALTTPVAEIKTLGDASPAGVVAPPVVRIAQAAAAPPPQACPVPIDPLAPVRALSEEELIALFS
jgi:hypothetical protein